MLQKSVRHLIGLCLLVFVVDSVSFAQGQNEAKKIDIYAANQRLGRGINLGNFLEVPRSDNWGVDIRESHLRDIKAIGFDSIRLPVKWSDYAAKSAPYTIEPSFFARVDQFIDRAEKEGLNVVLNIHHFYDLDKDPAGQLDRFVGIWKQLGEHYKNRGSFLYFELDNEPHDQLSETWNEVLVEGLKAVRASNPTRPIIIGPPFWNGIWALSKLQVPNDPNIIVTVHMYNPHPFTHQGASWADEKVRSIKDMSWGTAEDVEALNAEMDKAAAWGKEHNRPIYLGEFGAYSAAPQESRVRWTSAVARAAEERGMSWAYWEFAAGFGIYDLGNQSWHKDLLQALLPNAEPND